MTSNKFFFEIKEVNDFMENKSGRRYLNALHTNENEIAIKAKDKTTKHSGTYLCIATNYISRYLHHNYN